MLKRLVVLSILLALPTFCIAQGLESNLAAYWPFDDGEGTTATDASGNGHDGTLMEQAAWAEEGKVGGAVDLLPGDYVEVPDSPALNISGDLSISAWIRPFNINYTNDKDWTRAGIVVKGQNAIPWALQLGSVDPGDGAQPVLKFSFNQGINDPNNWIDPCQPQGDGYVIAKSMLMPLEEWTYVASSYNSVNYELNLIVNQDVHPASKKVRLGEVNEPVFIGVDFLAEAAGNEDGFFDGLIDDVRIFNQALSVNNLLAISGQMTKAFGPSPVDGAPAGGSLLQWGTLLTATGTKVYFGSSKDNLELVAELPGDATSHSVGQIDTFTQYYWRVDLETPDGLVTGDVWSYTSGGSTASNPFPPDKSIPIDLVGITMTWGAGAGAVAHDLYFGSSESAVANATTDSPEYKGRLELPSSNSGELEQDGKYFWRVDEVMFDGRIEEGQVWRFDAWPTIPEIPNLAHWYRFERGFGRLAIDWSGQGNDTLFNGGVEWAEGVGGSRGVYFDGVDDYTELEQPVDYNFTLMGWFKTARSSSRGGSGSNHAWAGDGLWYSDVPGFHNDYVMGITGDFVTWTCGRPGSADNSVKSTTEITDDEWHHVAGVRNDDTDFQAIYVDGVLEASDTFESDAPLNDRATVQFGANTWDRGYYQGYIDEVKIFTAALSLEDIQDQMRVDPRLAYAQSPTGIWDRELPVTLSWKPGENAEAHNVYFGTDSANLPLVSEAQTETTYELGLLEPGQTYYWRVDEIISGQVVEGNLWTFSVSQFLLIENFEEYDATNQVWMTWEDSWVPNYNTGAQAGYDFEPFVDTREAYVGQQSLPLMFDNSGFWFSDRTTNAKHSEIRRTWPSPQDWTAEDSKSLSLQFYGNANNTLMSTDTLYMGLEDADGKLGIVYYDGDPRIMLQESWNEFVVPLSEFGVDATRVKTLMIGIGNRENPVAGGQSPKPYEAPNNFGILIDAIRRYPARCEADLVDLPEDLNGDCKVDEDDLAVLAENFLAEGTLVTPTVPGAGNLTAHWPLDGNTDDVVGSMDGLGLQSITWAPGVKGQAANLNGEGDTIDLALGSAAVGSDSVTISVWAKTFFAGGNWQRLCDFGLDNTDYIALMAHRGNPSAQQGLRFAVNPAGQDGETTVDTAKALTFDEWTHVAAVLDADAQTGRIYLDGVLEGENTEFAVPASSVTSPTSNNIIGGSQYPNDGTFMGLIDELQIFNKALNLGQVSSLAGMSDAYYMFETDAAARSDVNRDGVVDDADKALVEAAQGKTALWP